MKLSKSQRKIFFEHFASDKTIITQFLTILIRLKSFRWRGTVWNIKQMCVVLKKCQTLFFLPDSIFVCVFCEYSTLDYFYNVKCQDL